MGRTAGIVRADGQVVTSAENSDLIVLQRQDVNAADQYTPRLITAQNLLAGSGGTTFAATSVPYADVLGNLTEDTLNLNYDDNTSTLLAANLETGGLSANTATVTNTIAAGGVSGSSGRINVYALGINNGYASYTSSAHTGNSVININVASQAATRIYTVPDAGASTSFVMAAGTQTIAGAKTFSSTVTTNGNLSCATAGGGLTIKNGANTTLGTAILSSGTVLVNNTSITADSAVFVTIKTLNSLAVAPTYYIYNLIPGTSFTINSSDITDDSEVYYLIVQST